MLLIFVASATPSSSIPRFKGVWETLTKKGGHAIGYGLLAWTYRRALAKGSPPRAGASAVSLGMSVLYALTDEAHQSLTPGRHPSGMDVWIDGTASAITLALLHVLFLLRRRMARTNGEG